MNFRLRIHWRRESYRRGHRGQSGLLPRQIFAVPHFQIEGMDINLSLVSRCQKQKPDRAVV